MHSRKKDHIQLALDGRWEELSRDKRFYYEPLLSATSNLEEVETSVEFLGHHFDFPLWISSMTGGTQMARTINENMARAAGEFGLGMGLGSCRSLLDSDDSFEDFNVREFIGNRPLYANIGIAQVEELLENNEAAKLEDLIGRLQANGLIVHINPLQEFAQPEGDSFSRAPFELLEELTTKIKCSYIIKEVGQGMGPKSLAALASLQIDAIELSAFGGTNFTSIENQRSEELEQPLIHVGHDIEEMIGYLKEIELNEKEIILSGGVSNFLDGYYFTEKMNGACLYGQAGSLLKHAMGEYSALQSHIEGQIKGFKMAKRLLTLRGDL